MIVGLREQLLCLHKECITSIRHGSARQEELLNFCISYLGHAGHFKYLKSCKALLNTRFILDCYHLLFFELTGTIVSDYYIHKTIEEIFAERFFFYKQE